MLRNGVADCEAKTPVSRKQKGAGVVDAATARNMAVYPVLTMSAPPTADTMANSRPPTMCWQRRLPSANESAPLHLVQVDDRRDMLAAPITPA